MSGLPTVEELSPRRMDARPLSDLLIRWRNVHAGLFGTGATVAGALAALGAMVSGYQARSAAGSVTSADRGRWLSCTGTWTLSLLAAATAGAGFAFVVANTGSGTITLDPDGSETIDGGSTVALLPGRAALVVCTGTAWETAALPGRAGGPVLAPAGTAAAPGLARADDADTGVFFPAANQVALAAGGVQALLASTTALTAPLPLRTQDGTVAAPAWSFSSDTDTGLYRIGADVLGLATGGAERVRVQSDGAVLIGGQVPGSFGGLRLSGSGNVFGVVSVTGFAASTAGSILNLGKTRGTSAGDMAIVQAGDVLGSVRFIGSDGATLVRGADIVSFVEGTPAADDVRARLVFRTSGAAGGNPVEAMRIDTSQRVGIGTTAPTVLLHVAGPVRVGSYTVATVPSASASGAGAAIYVSDESGGAVLAFSDGTNWRRTTDRAIIS